MYHSGIGIIHISEGVEEGRNSDADDNDYSHFDTSWILHRSNWIHSVLLGGPSVIHPTSGGTFCFMLVYLFVTGLTRSSLRAVGMGPEAAIGIVMVLRLSRDHKAMRAHFDKVCEEYEPLFLARPTYIVWAQPSAAVTYRFAFITEDPMIILHKSHEFMNDLLSLYFEQS